METSSENSLIPMDPILVEAKQASTSAEAKQTASRKRPRPVKTYRCRGTKDKSDEKCQRFFINCFCVFLKPLR